MTEIRFHCVKCGKLIASEMKERVLNLPQFITFIIECQICKLRYTLDYGRLDMNINIEDF